MSTKTTFKRIALVTVAALGFGLLSSVAPASAGVAQSLTVAVGPNGATSLTVVGGDSGTASALVRIDVTSNDSAAGQAGLTGSEIVTGTVTAVPTSVTAKTLAANGGSMADTITVPGAGKSDFSMINSGAGSAQASGTPAGTAATSSSGVTNWGNKFVTGVNTFNDSGTPATAQGTTDLGVATGVIKAGHTGYVNMDSNKATTVSGTFTKSYYVTIIPRANALVMDQGAYTFSFQLTDGAGVVRSTKTVKIDFVTTNAKSDASIALATSGTFLTGTAVAGYDTATTSNYATLTLTNRDGGLVRKYNGDVVVPSATLQKVYTGLITADSFSFTVDDSGTYGADFGTKTAVAGNGTLKAYDGVYGLTATANQIGAQATATGFAFQIWAAFGNATIKTAALTLFAPDGSGSASTAKTDVQLTAAGILATDALKVSNLAATKAYTLPTTATSASLKFWIADATDTATGGAAITVTPTWSAYGSNAVTPATSTTGTVYTTDALGNFTVSVTNTTPVDGASLSLVLSGGLAFGAGTNTVTLTWKDPVATTISVVDPVTGAYVKTGSTNVTTVKVTDQFGNAVANQGVSVAIPGTTDANYSATATISPIKTGADGTATYSLVGGATTATADTVSFNCIPTACAAAATVTYNYVTTLPVVATMAAYHGLSWDAAATLTPSTGIYATGTTKLLLKTARNLSVASLSDSVTTDDQIALRFTALTSAGVSATGAVVTVTAGEGGHIVGASGLPVKSRNYVVGATGTAVINVLATGTGAITFTATSGTVTATASMWVANATTDARFVSITSATTGTANGSGVPVTVTVTDRYGNVVSGVAVNVVASGVGSFMGGSITNSFTTDASGTYTFLANTVVSEGGVAKFTATSWHYS
jgi:trimeric autotransporter adhesin